MDRSPLPRGRFTLLVLPTLLALLFRLLMQLSERQAYGQDGALVDPRIAEQLVWAFGGATFAMSLVAGLAALAILMLGRSREAMLAAILNGCASLFGLAMLLLGPK